MKKLFLGLVVLMLAVAVSAKDKGEKTNTDMESTAAVALTGTVYDSDSGETLVGVEVQLEGTTEKAYTDFDGKFTFENVKPGDCKIVANYISYNKATETLKLDGKKNEVKIQLKNSN
ncbi:CarboxypepD_reg-like domain-containing protein [Mariniphaga anaerophila]|uniref:CarboxypepD_reg-like domain-containing protein n=1 Tax=Mariniphaga anaerophila TaxID=1484053 RepID=A0A1M5BWZ0_9BACT|nr:carboxypeptidase-like regulatory domain-containing protein [Mariniphaga anaerophila]SHF46900.1 CarboxypepD_reg-like domain-containing protein [Mariniphaga anaerophila]